ncbi:MAG: hypothetical protein HYZ09_03735 [Candidatus Kerfeldbacteria bacterium]|nr:hypothetical protein [Candidatus Kerfeldbacteria bacterium]
MNPKQFLTVGGVILVLVGILGFVNVIGPSADKSIFGEAWWFDNAENWTHLILGIVALIAAYALPKNLHKPLVLLVGIVGIIVGVYSIFTPTLGAANLENPADTILHLAIGVWALVAGMGKAPAMTGPMT